MPLPCKFSKKLHSRYSKYIFAAFLLLIFSTILFSQNPRRVLNRAVNSEVVDTVRPILDAIPDTIRNLLPAAADTTGVIKDSLTLIQDSIRFAKDSIARADSLFKADSLDLLHKSSLAAAAFSHAGDSIKQDFSNGKRMIYYFGETTVKYQNMELKANYMEFDMNKNEVFASGVLDSLSGEWNGQPVMKMGAESYEMEKLRYNFNSNKARITNMKTKDDEGTIHGTNIKMMPDRSINLTDGKYTVCDLDDPHFFLHLTSAKVVTKPSQKTVFGPAWPVVAGVPVPLVVPYGFIPEKPQRATGMLMPTFGEETARGFYMRDAGMYFVFGDYLDLSVTGDYYTMGSWAVDVNSRYKVNYKFNGSVGLTYSNDVLGDKGSTDYSQTTNFAVKWSHSQDSKARPGTSFSASVNFSTPGNNRFNSTSINEALQSQTSSSISFSKNWSGKYNLSINALHSQNTRDESYSFTLPNVTFSMSTIYPFKQKNRVGKERVYEKISFGYNTSFQNRISFKASEFGQEGFLNKFQNGMNHNFSIGLPSFTLFKYLNVSPGISYGQNWFFKKINNVYFDEESNKVVTEQGNAFSSLGITQTYSMSASMSTRIYGMFNFGRGRLQAIRHVISPSISASLSPELGTSWNGWRSFEYIDAKGQKQTYDYNIYSGQMNSYPSKGKNASLNFSIGNNLEAKVKDSADSTGVGTKKIKLLDQLTINGGYNFLAERNKMNSIGVSTSTNLFNKVNISANMTLDPYAIDENGNRSDTYQFKVNPAKPVRLTQASASASYSISGKGHIEGNDQQNGSTGSAVDSYQRIYYHPVTGEYIPGGWVYYLNPNIPWNLSFSYSFGFRKSYRKIENELVPQNQFTQTLNMNGSIRLSPRMSINGTSGFDVQAMKITTTQLSATYDLHCFNISLSWVPYGTYKSYSFKIAANASTLADILRFKKSSSYFDN